MDWITVFFSTVYDVFVYRLYDQTDHYEASIITCLG